MKGLIKKDLLLLKSQLKSYLVIVIVFAIVSFMSNDNTFITLLPILGVMLIISTLSFDNYYKWDAFALTLPLSRKDNVKSKYALAVLITLTFVILATIILIAFNTIKGLPINAFNILTLMCGSLLGASIATSISMPLMYKFGSENGRMIMIIMVFAIGGVIAGITELLNPYFDQAFLYNALTFISTNLLPITILVMIILLSFSYFLTLKIYMRKEF